VSPRVNVSPVDEAGTVGESPSSPAALHHVGLGRRLLGRPIAVACLSYLILVVGVAIVAPLALPNVVNERAGNLLATNQTPSAAHWLGTDTVGRDILQRLLVGTRVTMLGVAEALIVVLALGVTFGLLAGFYGGWIDRLVTWLADLTFSIPAIVIVLVVLSVFPSDMLAAMVTLGVLAAPGLMRLVRAATLPVRRELYVESAQVAGLSRPYIVTRHVLPRILGPVFVQASLLGAVALLVQTGLAFLGLLAPEPAPSWGGMIADGITVITLDPWQIWPAGVAVALTALALGMLGDAIRDATVEGWGGPATSDFHRRLSPQHAAEIVGRPSSAPDAAALLAVKSLDVGIKSKGGLVRVLEDVTFDVRHGETVGIVGETGCGKSMTASAVLGLLPGGAVIERGRIWLSGRDLAAASEKELRKVRGKEIGFISQEPMIGLDPVFRVGAQLAEVVRTHHGVSQATAKDHVHELLESVRLPNPDAVAKRYPHELSGGMAQRVAIARALAGGPKLLIADEPTTALDVTLQADILDLFRQLQREQGLAILIITHDWGVVADLCDRAVVMYGGQIVERADVRDTFREPLHPYTKALLASNPHGIGRMKDLPTIPGTVPAPGTWPAGCRFRSRCTYATAQCGDGRIDLAHPTDRRETRCVHYTQMVNE
jgi:peptide/nickel transport system ATP-binding protein/peptide/nickel transport system permease protein